jgi:hypothetical protein
MANLERPFNQTSSRTNDVSTLSTKGHMGFGWKDRGDENMGTSNAETTMETGLELAGEIAQSPGPPGPLPQSFKCEKCGAAFADEGAAVVHIQTCIGPEGNLDEPTPS